MVPCESAFPRASDARNGSLKIHQDAEVWLWRLEAGETATVEVPEGKGCWIQIVEGEIEVGGEILKGSDGVGVGETIEIKATERTELMGFLL